MTWIPAPRLLPAGTGFADEYQNCGEKAFCGSIKLIVKVYFTIGEAWRSKGLVRMAREKLLDPKTGLLVSSYSLAGTPMDGPEGSSIWMAIHCLDLIDQRFAAQQYQRAKEQLGGSLLGFGYAREWPRSRTGPMDVDSGPVVPVLGASPSSSGLALVAAASQADRPFYASLTGSLELVGFPRSRQGRLRYCAANQLGEAVVLYSTVQGPLWNRIKKGSRP